MPFRVFRVPQTERARLDAALGDDILSRQSITLRDARRVGRQEDAIYVFVEGEQAGLFRAEALILTFGERATEPGELMGRLKAEEDSAAEGLGSIFGD